MIAMALLPAVAAAQPAPAIGSAFEMRVGQTVQVRDTTLAIRLAKVTDDSRCPKEVRCIAAGDASVVLQLRVARLPRRTVTLHAGQAPRETTVGDFEVSLVGLAPAPSLAAPPQQKDYVVTLRVAR